LNMDTGLLWGWEHHGPFFWYSLEFEPREVQGDTDLEAFADLLPWTNHYVPAPRRKYIPQ
jgi:hypothetical protein